MKFCLYEILDAMEAYRENNGEIESEALASYLEQLFGVPVSDEGLFEATFVQFCNEYCG